MKGAGHAIQAARTILRPVSIEEVGYLHHLWTDSAVRRFFWDDEVVTRERAEAAVREAVESFGCHGFGLWIAENRGEGGAPVGFVACVTSTTGPK